MRASVAERGPADCEGRGRLRSLHSGRCPRRGWLAWAVAVLLLPLAPAAAQPADPVVTAAGLNLPEQLCSLPRQRLDIRPDGLQASYGIPGNGTLQVYVARVTQPLGDEFVDTEESIRRLHFDVVLLRELQPPPGAPDALGRLWRGSLPSGPIVTGLWLWHHAGWRIKLRGTVFAAAADRIWPRMECAARALASPSAPA